MHINHMLIHILKITLIIMKRHMQKSTCYPIEKILILQSRAQNYNVFLSAGSVNFHAKLKIHSTWGSTDLDEIYTACRLYRVYSIPKIFLKTIT